MQNAKLECYNLKQCYTKIQNKLQCFRYSISSETQQAIDIYAYIELLKTNFTTQQNLYNDLLIQKSNIEDDIVSLQQQVSVQNELIELETFASYTPRFNFSNAYLYKNRLEKIRYDQKTMLQNGTAAVGFALWNKDNDPKNDVKLVRDMKKLCLRAFNSECDNIVASTTFSNINKSIDRVKKIYEAVSTLGKSLTVNISTEYLNLKLDELTLSHEYSVKKKQEKEDAQELRIYEQEITKAKIELEQSREIALKEQMHFEGALDRISTQMQYCSNDKQKEDLQEQKNKLFYKLSEINTKLSDIDYRITNQRAGYVYIISNIGAFGENVYKIGMARRLDPNHRISELSDASVPFRFDTHAMIFSNDAPALESALHRAFDNKKLNMINKRREFFNVTLEEIKSVIYENHDKTVEFIEYPKAEQYRESKKLHLLQ